MKSILPEDLFPKAKHVILEDARVHQAGESLKKGDLIRFGELMKASHESLSKDYEVSCAELDFLASESWEKDYVLGSRMMGGGFGGCTINLLEEIHLADFKNFISDRYQEKFGIEPDFIEVKLSDGAHLVD